MIKQKREVSLQKGQNGGVTKTQCAKVSRTRRASSQRRANDGLVVQRDSSEQDCVCSGAAWLQDPRKWSKGKCNNFVHQLWTHQVYRALVR